ncbi:type II-A CRISPR-associated protein Csn2 [Floricoccus tropicus]|uniref:Type II-A CRISPR-associated protein Csn2 n=1 Tax=Floricoccus tropicus TaxID=1859473 RepID=A0A1E8GQ52_9LACT|nr:type II-A CRISPR-associated protein Csn2 [Floricoccus tropicus]
MTLTNLNYIYFDEKINIDSWTILSIENTKVFAKFIENIKYYDYQQDLKLFDKNYNAVKSSKILVINDILNFELNNVGVLKTIYSDIDRQIKDNLELRNKIHQLKNEISNLLIDEIIEYPLDLSFDEITNIELIKSLGVKINESSTSLYEKLIDILNLYKFLPNKELLILTNVSCYFSKDEMEELRRHSSLLGGKVLLVEPRKVYGFPQYMLDDDFYMSSIL